MMPSIHRSSDTPLGAVFTVGVRPLKIAVATLCLGLWALPAHGQEADVEDEDEDVVAKAPDYGPAFEKLIALGLPDIEGLEYGTFSADEFSDRNYFGGSGAEVLKAGITGNGWRSGDKGESGSYRFIHVNGRAYETRAGSAIGRIMGSGQSDDSVLRGKWKGMKIEEDLARALKAIQTWEPQDNRYTVKYSMPSAAKILLFASQAWRAGFKDEANNVVWHLLTKTTSPELVIDGVINEIANQQYSQLVDEFTETADWKAYFDGMGVLLEKFPRGWNSRDAVAMVMTSVKVRLGEDWSGIEIPAKLDGIEEPLSAESLKIVEELTDWRGSLGYLQYNLGNWIVEDSASRGFEGPVRDLLKLKMEAVPVLAALIDNQTPLAVVKDEEPYYMMNSMINESVNASDLYERGLSRPMTIDELARKLLQPILPSSQGENNQVFYSGSSSEKVDATALRNEAIKYYKEQRTASPEDRLFSMLDGDLSQASSAMSKIVREENAALIKRLEERLLQPDQIASSVRMVNVYLTLREQEGAEFFARYEPLFRKAYASADEDDEIRETFSDLEEAVSQMRLLVEPVSAEDLVALIVDDETDMNQVYTMVRVGAKSKGLERSLALMNAIDLKASPEKIETLTQCAYYSWYYYKAAMGGELYDESANEEEEVVAESNEFLTRTRDKWQALLKDHRTNPASDRDGSDVASSTAYYILSISGQDERIQQLYDLYSKLGPESHSLAISSAAALLDGRDQEKLPNQESVAEEKKVEIKEALGKMDREALIAFREGLNFSEKLVYAARMLEIEKPSEALLGTLRKIGRLEIAPELSVDLSWLKVGDVLDLDTINRIEKAAREAENGDKEILMHLSIPITGSGASFSAKVVESEDVSQRMGLSSDQTGPVMTMYGIVGNPIDSAANANGRVTITDFKVNPEDYDEYSSLLESFFSDSGLSSLQWVLFLRGAEVPVEEAE